MKICVIGAGVIGVSTAYMLGRLGHEVIVIDQASDVAKGTSAANGAQLSYSYVEPLAGPETLKSLPKYLLGFDPALRFGFSFNSTYLSWGIKFLGNCLPAKFNENYKARINLAAYSREVLDLIHEEILPDKLTGSGKGKMVLIKSQDALENIQKKFDRNNQAGVSLRVISKEECINIEPALTSWTGNYIGGLYGKEDIALDTQLFCKTLKDAAIQKYHVEFIFGSKVEKIETGKANANGVITNREDYKCDAVILCAGHKSNQLLRPLGMHLPTYPMQGYSLTLPIMAKRTKCSITDAHHKVVFANLGDRVRIAGFMDANLPKSKILKRCDQLRNVARLLWPDIADYNADPHYWNGFRPMVPSGVPVIKETKIKGIYLNGGHGSLGYTFALGSAMKLAKLIGHDNKNKFG